MFPIANSDMTERKAMVYTAARDFSCPSTIRSAREEPESKTAQNSARRSAKEESRLELLQQEGSVLTERHVENEEPNDDDVVGLAPGVGLEEELRQATVWRGDRSGR
jgi:hypothetical protein